MQGTPQVNNPACEKSMIEEEEKYQFWPAGGRSVQEGPTQSQRVKFQLPFALPNIWLHNFTPPTHFEERKMVLQCQIET